MQVTINGAKDSIPDDLSVAGLLTRLKVEPIRAAVEINENLVRRTTWTKTMVREGDRIEIVTLVGGG